MKNVLSRVISILLLSFGVMGTAWPKMLDLELNHLSDQHQSDQTDPVILEVTQKGIGLISPNLKQLFFRLHTSGMLEFELAPDLDTDPPDFTPIRKQSRLSPEKVNEVVQLITNSEFLKTPNEYSPLIKWDDAAMILVITCTYPGLKKQIQIINYCPEHIQGQKHYPVVLKNLLEKVVELRPKTSSSSEDTGYGILSVCQQFQRKSEGKNLWSHHWTGLD